MSRNIKDFIIFISGMTFGSFITWQCVKNKYERISQEEIDSVKEYFSRRVIAEDVKKNGEFNEYVQKINDQKYNGDSKIDGDDSVEKPYVISPEEFGEFDDYHTVSLTYYDDKVLADDDDNVVDDVENIVGFDSLTHFGEYEEDSVFVRNDKLRCDYEILMDQRKYSDIANNKPHPMEEK